MTPPRLNFYYLPSEAREKLDKALDVFPKRGTSDTLLAELETLLPMEAQSGRSHRRRVEGMIYCSERLWSMAMDVGKKEYGADFSRQDLIRLTRSRPMSHYRYLTGSREPMEVLLTRDDALEDPGTALVKFRGDIEALIDFIKTPPESSGR
jgi:hypothetical protein